jgi:hypothetical protein
MKYTLRLNILLLRIPAAPSRVVLQRESSSIATLKPNDKNILRIVGLCFLYPPLPVLLSGYLSLSIASSGEIATQFRLSTW